MLARTAGFNNEEQKINKFKYPCNMNNMAAQR